MIAVNDQRGINDRNIKKAVSAAENIGKKAKDPFAQATKMYRGKDVFGNTISQKKAHSKYVFAAEVVPVQSDMADDTSDRVAVKSYLISHSLPRFPNFEKIDKQKQILPSDPRKVFSKNVGTGLAKGQHYFCQSFENEESLVGNALEYEAKKISKYIEQGRAIVAVHQLFKVIDAAVVFSSYLNAHNEPYNAVYKNLFDPRKEFKGRHTKILSVHDRRRLYPIGAHVKADLRKTSCESWDNEDIESECIQTFSFTTTNKQYGLKFHATAQHGLVEFDMFGDIIASQVNPREVYEHPADPQFATKFITDVLLVQSWMDYSTLANQERILIPAHFGTMARSKVWIFNVLNFKYPVSMASAEDTSEPYVRVQSLGTNHSKIAFSVPMNSLGYRDTLFCFCDKNRSLTQMGRNGIIGRGGASWCTKSGILSTLMLSLHPNVVNNQAVDNVPVNVILEYLPEDKPSPKPTVIQFSGLSMETAVPSRRHKGAYFVGIYRNPFMAGTCPVDRELPNHGCSMLFASPSNTTEITQGMDGLQISRKSTAVIPAPIDDQYCTPVKPTLASLHSVRFTQVHADIADAFEETQTPSLIRRIYEYLGKSYFLTHLHNGWQVDQAILTEEEKLVVIRFGRDWDPECMKMDEVLFSIAEKVKQWVSIYVVDIDEVPDFNKMYELYDPCTTMIFYRNKHMMIDLGTGNNNKINWALEDKQEMLDLLEVVYKGAKKGKGLVVSPRDYSSRYQY